MSLCVKQSQCGADCLASSAFGNDIMAVGLLGKVRLEKLGRQRQKAALRSACGGLSLYLATGGKFGSSPSDFLSLLTLANVGLTKSDLLGPIEASKGGRV